MTNAPVASQSFGSTCINTTDTRLRPVWSSKKVKQSDGSYKFEIVEWTDWASWYRQNKVEFQHKGRY